MRLSIALLLAAASLVSACTRPVVRETVVERPVVTKETTVVERPAPAAPAAVGATAPNCNYASQSYSHGAMSCQDGAQHRCNNGIWERTVNAC